MANVSDLIKALGFNPDYAVVVDEGEDTALVEVTTAPFGQMMQLLPGVDLTPKSVKGSRLVIEVPIAELEAAVEAGKTVSKTASSRQVDYDVQTTTLYEVKLAEGETTANDIGLMTWIPDAGVGTIEINGDTYHIESATSEELFEDPANPDRRQVYITVSVDGEEVILTSGSPSGFLKRVLNYNKRLDPKS